jgi:hypothetical protein
MSEQLSIAVNLIDSVMKDPNLDQKHRPALDHAVTILFHEGVVRDEENEKKEPVRQLLKELEQELLKNSQGWGHGKEDSTCREFRIKFKDLGAVDIQHCLNLYILNGLCDVKMSDKFIIKAGAMNRLAQIAHQQYGLSLKLPAC